MSDQMQRLRDALEAMGRALPAPHPRWVPWRVVEGDDVPQLGWGRSDGRPRVALVCSHTRDPLGPRRGCVVWQAETWDGSLRWHWVVDGNQGVLEEGDGPHLRSTLRDGLWPALWSATVDTLSLVAELLRGRGVAEMEAHIGGGDQPVVRWEGPVTLEIETWRVRHGDRYRVIREALSNRAKAELLAALAVDYVERVLDGDAHARFGPTRGRYGVQRATVPPLPAEAAAVLGAAGSLVDEWRDRLREALADEDEAAFERRKAKMEQRAGTRLHLPGAGLDEYGREIGWGGQPQCGPVLEVPAAVLGALWALGLGLRVISQVTTGRPTSRNTINKRIKLMRQGGDGWSKHAKASALIGRQDLRWAEERGRPPLLAIAEDTTLPRPDPAPGAEVGTGVSAVRVRRRQPRPDPAAGVDPRTPQEPVIRVRRRPADDELAPVGTRPDPYMRFRDALQPQADAFLDIIEERGRVTVREAVAALSVSPVRLADIQRHITRWAHTYQVVLPYIVDETGDEWVYEWSLPAADDVPPTAEEVDEAQPLPRIGRGHWLPPGERSPSGDWSEWHGTGEPTADSGPVLEALAAALDDERLEYQWGATGNLRVAAALLLVVEPDGAIYQNARELPVGPDGLASTVIEAVYQSHRDRNRGWAR